MDEGLFVVANGKSDTHLRESYGFSGGNQSIYMWYEEVQYAINCGLLKDIEDEEFDDVNASVVAFYTDMRNDGKLLTRSSINEEEDDEEEQIQEKEKGMLEKRQKPDYITQMPQNHKET